MRIGLVAKWFASGQGVVARQLRSALDDLGHETHVLARPGRGPRAAKREGAAEREDPVWLVPRVSEASAHEIGEREYLDWAEEAGLDCVFFDENYSFEAVSALRRRGVRTIGRFVWESFPRTHVEAALESYDVVYSLTRAERERYAGFGIDSPRVRWGIHPELLEAAQSTERDRDDGIVRYLFPTSFLSPRKPVRAVLEAFRATSGEHLALTLCAQLPRRAQQLERAAGRDPRLTLELGDLPTTSYLELFARADVCLAPSRWEGLGVPLYEASAFGLPIITNDAAPMNEVVLDGHNGLLVPSAEGEVLASGIAAQEVDQELLTLAIERIADDGERARLAAGSRLRREELAWRNTVEDLAALLSGGGASV